MDRLEYLSRATGLTMARIQQLHAQQLLHTLYDANGQPIRQQQGTRSMTTWDRRKQLTDMRYAPTRLTPHQKIIELYRLKAEWTKTPAQIRLDKLERIRDSWA